MTTSSDQELAWAAGVFEATGGITLSDGRPYLSVKQVSPDGQLHDMVGRFHAIVQVGKVGGPYRDRRPGRRPISVWYAVGHDAASVVRLLWPWLGPSKRALWDGLAQR